MPSVFKMHSPLCIPVFKELVPFVTSIDFQDNTNEISFEIKNYFNKS